ncbi:hypothetical protein HNQ56_002495 [Anaerotaenia torta]|uniref:DUF4321 domain-containing protein n=1 Tax=Anaerotaenia torta TaxID=433293 RepID=UPI003D249CF0
MARVLSKNRWALFLLLLAGMVVGSFIGYLLRGAGALSWLDYGMNFSIGNVDKGNIVTLDLGVLVLHFGFRLKITIASVIGAAIAVIIYKKL